MSESASILFPGLLPWRSVHRDEFVSLAKLAEATFDVEVVVNIDTCQVQAKLVYVGRESKHSKEWLGFAEPSRTTVAQGPLAKHHYLALKSLSEAMNATRLQYQNHLLWSYDFERDDALILEGRKYFVGKSRQLWYDWRYLCGDFRPPPRWRPTLPPPPPPPRVLAIDYRPVDVVPTEDGRAETVSADTGPPNTKSSKTTKREVEPPKCKPPEHPEDWIPAPDGTWLPVYNDFGAVVSAGPQVRRAMSMGRRLRARTDPWQPALVGQPPIYDSDGWYVGPYVR